MSILSNHSTNCNRTEELRTNLEIGNADAVDSAIIGAQCEIDGCWSMFFGVTAGSC